MRRMLILLLGILSTWAAGNMAIPAARAAGIEVRDPQGPDADLLEPAAEELRHLLFAENGYARGSDLSIELAWAQLDLAAGAAEYLATLRDAAGRRTEHRFKADPVRLLSPFSGSREAAFLARPVLEKLLPLLPAPPQAPPSFDELREAACASAPLPPPRLVAVLGVQGEHGCGPLCRAALLTHGYAAVEAEVGAADLRALDAGTPPYGLADRPGLWQFRRARPGDPACRAFERLRATDAGGDAADSESCIAATPVARGSATVIAERDFLERRYGWGFDLVERERLRDAATGALLAERERHGLQRLDRPAPSGILWCPDDPSQPLFARVAPPLGAAADVSQREDTP